MALSADQRALDEWSDLHNILSRKGLPAPKNFGLIGANPSQDGRFMEALAQMRQAANNSPKDSQRSGGGGLSPLEQGYKTLAQDRMKLAGTNYPAYKGQTVADKSMLMQKAEDLTNKYATRRAPYTSKLQMALGRGNQGFAPGDTQGLLGTLGADQGQFRGNLLQVLQNNFRNSYNPRVNDFNQKTNADIQRGLNEAEGQLGNIDRAAGNLEGARNQQLVKSLQALQAQKIARREAFVNNLTLSGNQEQAHSNLGLNAQRAQFDRQVNDPQRKMGLLSDVLGRNAGNLEGGGVHPALEEASNAEIAQALKAYNIPYSGYKGPLVADLPPEIIAGNKTLLAMNPALRDSYSKQRKAALGNLMNSQPIGSKALANVPGAIRGETTQLEEDARNAYDKDLASLNNKYIRMGQYNSPSHLAAADERAREINRLVSGHRNRLTQSSLKDQLNLQNNSDINSIGNLNQLGEQGQQEYGNLFNNIRNLNHLGANKWKNQQQENEELYKNYQNQSNWEWPQGKVAGGGMPLIGGGNRNNVNPIVAPNQMDIGFNNLGNQNIAYNPLSTPSVPAPTINDAAQAQSMLAQQQAQAAAQAQAQAQATARAQQQAQQQAQVAAQQQAQRDNAYTSAEKAYYDYQRAGAKPYINNPANNPFYQYGDAYRQEMQRYRADGTRLYDAYKTAEANRYT